MEAWISPGAASDCAAENLFQYLVHTEDEDRWTILSL